jgi:hypothetical protein
MTIQKYKTLPDDGISPAAKQSVEFYSANDCSEKLNRRYVNREYLISLQGKWVETARIIG